jgi:hypothetical protein
MKMISRRLVLKGAFGATLALPVLESLGGRGNRAFAQAKRDRFFIVVRVGNGIVQESNEGPDKFWPKALGALTTDALKQATDRAMSELADYAPKLTLVKNVALPFARGGCNHSEAIVQALTAQKNTGGSGNTPKALGMSVDWAIANALNPKGVGPLTFMAGPQSAYIAEALSWSASGQRTPAERSPFNAYKRLTGLASAAPEVQQLIATRRKSVNDLVRSELQSLLAVGKLSTSDRQRLQQHLAAVRDIEVQTTCDLDAEQVNNAKAITQPEGNDVRPKVVQAMMDVAAWAFNCGLNHAVTLQVGDGNDGTQYTVGGVVLPRFHWISHRVKSDGGSGEAIPDAVSLHASIDRLQIQLFKHLLDRLNAYPSPNGGKLLDDCMAAWTNDLGAGPSHAGDNLPWVFAGGAGGSLKTGQFVDLKKKKNNIVLNTILTAMGVKKADGSPTDDFGDASLAKGVVSEILA